MHAALRTTALRSSAQVVSGHTQKTGSFVSRAAGVTAAMKYDTVSKEGSSLEVVRVPMLTGSSDNYGWIMRDVATGITAAVDPAEPPPILEALQERGWKLDMIVNTHHHWDHTGGNLELKEGQGCTVTGPRADAHRTPGIDTLVAEGDTVSVGDTILKVLETPGHTTGHITFWDAQSESLFPGDTLFAMGCGRLFEGTPEQMWTSMQKFLPLPPCAAVYCAHEYTQANAKWAIAVDPDNAKLQERVAAVKELRSQNKPTVPSTLQEEFDTNPFLRPSDAGIRKTLGVPMGADDGAAWAAIRAHKDNF